MKFWLSYHYFLSNSQSREGVIYMHWNFSLSEYPDIYPQYYFQSLLYKSIEMKKQISKMKNSKAAGIDGLSAVFVKDKLEILVPFITHCINPLATGNFQIYWPLVPN